MPETRRAVADKVRKSFESVPFIVDVDNSYGVPAQRVRVAIDQDNLEYYSVEQSRRVRHAARPLWRREGRLLAPWRRPPADPDRALPCQRTGKWLTSER